jgi:hypothetical protein
MSLEACSRCRRHIHPEADCPFCGASSTGRPARKPLLGTITRAAIVGAGLLTACEGTALPAYGAAIFDAGTDASDGATDAGEPETGAIPPYGVPPRPDGG